MNQAALRRKAVFAVEDAVRKYNRLFSLSLSPPEVRLTTDDGVFRQNLSKYRQTAVYPTSPKSIVAFYTIGRRIYVNPSPLVEGYLNRVLLHEVGHFIQYEVNPFCRTVMARYWETMDRRLLERSVIAPDPESFVLIYYLEGGAEWASSKVYIGPNLRNTNYGRALSAWESLEASKGFELTRRMFLRGTPAELCSAFLVANLRAG